CALPISTNIGTSVTSGRLEFARTVPFAGDWLGPRDAQGRKPLFPTGRWVRITTYLRLQGTAARVQQWQDGEPVLRADGIAGLDEPGRATSTVFWTHFGMYAGQGLRSGTVYNDSIQLWQLGRPLTDDELESEPDCFARIP